MCLQRQQQQTHAVLGYVGCQQLYEEKCLVGSVLDKLSRRGQAGISRVGFYVRSLRMYNVLEHAVRFHWLGSQHNED